MTTTTTEKKYLFLPNACIVVDSSHSQSTLMTEYKGVHPQTGKLLFKKEPFKGTNNIGEFLAIVDAIEFCYTKNKKGVTICSDSLVAIKWVKDLECKTNLDKENPIFKKAVKLVESAEFFLFMHSDFIKNHITIQKWETKEWGENPADYGRK